MKEGIWLEPALALLRQKTKEDRTEKHRNVARKLVFEGGWVQKRLRMQQEVLVKGGRWAEEIPQRWRQPKGADRTEMRKEAERLRCTLLNGSAWSTERKYMRRYEGKCDIVFGIEHRLSKEEMEEQFKREAKEGWRFAADAARITHETAGSEDRKHTSGGVFIAVYSNLGAVVGEKEGTVASIQRRKNRPSMGKRQGLGKCARRSESFRLSFGRMDSKKRSPSGGGVEESQNQQASMAGGMRR